MAVKTTKKKKSDTEVLPTVMKTVDPEYIGTIRVSAFNHSIPLYTKLYLYLYGSILKNYKFRKKKIGFLFEDGQFVKMKVRTALINMIFWKPYCDTKTIITVDTLFDTKYISEKTIEDKMNLIIERFKPVLTIEEMCKCIRHIVESLARIPMDFCKIIGNTMSMRDIIDLANKHPDFNDILHTQYADDTPISQIESDIMVRTNRAKDIIESDIESNLRPFLKAGGNVNLGQMSQCIVSIGPRSDIYGNIAPVIVNTNFVLGLRNVSDYYLESYSCRKALIANRYQMSDSGYTSRQIDLLCIDSCLVDVEDCGTETTIDLFIPDEKTLKMLEFKYIDTGKRDAAGKVIYHEIKPKHDKHLIGTTVKHRSPIVCGLDEGKICKKCYGELSYATLGYHTGLIASHSLSMPLSQTVLSTKHLTKTRSRKIVWSDKMKKYFDCETENVFIKQMYSDMSAVEIGFYIEDIEEYLNMWSEIEEDDDDVASSDDKNNMLLDYVTRFNLSIGGEVIPFDSLDTDLYINHEFLNKIMKSNKIEDGVIYVSLSAHATDIPIFDINIENMEIGVFLKRIMSLLGIKSKVAYTTIEDLLKLLTAAIVEVGISVNYGHLESIIYNMIRDPNMIIHRPNFKEKNPQYTILPTCSAIMYSRSLTTSLAFERIAQQLSNVFTYYKDSPGFLDPFFQ